MIEQIIFLEDKGCRTTQRGVPGFDLLHEIGDIIQNLLAFQLAMCS